MKIAAILARRSRKSRDRADGIQFQIDADLEYAKHHGYVVPKEFIYKDDNKTGRNANRHGLQKLLTDARAGKFRYVLVWKLDRLARDVGLSLALRRELAACGVQIISVTEWVNDNTVNAKEMAYMLNVKAEIEIDRIRENTNRGLMGNAKRSLSAGGIAPYGYDMVKKRLVVKEFEAAAVQLAFTMYADGANKQTICDFLNNSGYRTKAGRKFTENSFDWIFRNPKYIGTYVYDGYDERVENPETVPAIIDLVTWNKVQERNAIARQRQNVTVPRNTYPLSGLVKCSCGLKMHANKGKTGRDKKERIEFFCKAHKVDKTCPTKAVNMEYINELVETLITRELLPSFEPIKAGLAGIQGKLNAAEKKQQSQIRREVSKLDEVIQRLGNRLGRVEDDVTAGVIGAEIAERKEQLHDLSRELQALENKVKPSNMTDKRLRYLLSRAGAALINNGTKHDERVVLHTLIESITVSNDNIEVRLNMP